MPPVFQKPFAITGLVIGLCGVAAVTIVFSRLLTANASTVGYFFLLVVLGVATASGFRVAALVSLAAMLCFNFYFMPPLGRFIIADPENWVALATFLLTALVASHLSDRARKQADEARRRQQETEQLYALSRAILLTEASRPIGTQAAQSIAQIFDSSLVMILDGKTNLRFQGGPEEAEGLEEKLRDVIRQGNHQRDPSQDLDIWPIALGGKPIGALAAKGIRVTDAAIQSLLNLVAIALERVRTLEAANRAEVARQSEEFKSTLLDAIAHEFKTPLTSIKAAATGLHALETAMRPDQLELASIISEEADRLSQLVSEAVRMAEIDAGKVKPRYALVDPAELLRMAQQSFHNRGAERFRTAGAAIPIPRIPVDPDLLLLALRQVLDNALKYSDPSTFVQCEAGATADRVTIRIADQGPGIPERDGERVFDKFYRGATVRDRFPGTGLGLHIAREIARIHGGDLWVEPPHGDGRGAVFCFTLPVAEQERP